MIRASKLRLGAYLTFLLVAASACNVGSERFKWESGKIYAWREAHNAASRVSYCLLFSKGTFYLGDVCTIPGTNCIQSGKMCDIAMGSGFSNLSSSPGRWGILVLEVIPPEVDDWSTGCVLAGHTKVLYIDGNGDAPWTKRKECEVSLTSGDVRIGLQGEWSWDPNTYSCDGRLRLLNWDLIRVNHGVVRINLRKPHGPGESLIGNSYRLSLAIDGVVASTCAVIGESGEEDLEFRAQMPFAMYRGFNGIDCILPPKTKSVWPFPSMLIDGDVFLMNTPSLAGQRVVSAQISAKVMRRDWIDWSFELNNK